MIIAVSDLHGNMGELNRVIKITEPYLKEGSSKLVVCGDNIGRGRDDYIVIKTLFEMEEIYGNDKIVLLRGNHEQLAVEGEWPVYWGDKPVSSEEKEIIMNRLRELPYYFHDEETDILFCHAGILIEKGDDVETARKKALDMTNDRARHRMLLSGYTYGANPPAFRAVVCGHTPVHIITGIRAYSRVYTDRFRDEKGNIYSNGWYYIDGGIGYGREYSACLLRVDGGEICELDEKGEKQEIVLGMPESRKWWE